MFGNYLIDSYVVANTLIDMALHVSPSTYIGSFVAHNLLTLIHTLSSKLNPLIEQGLMNMCFYNNKTFSENMELFHYSHYNIFLF